MRSVTPTSSHSKKLGPFHARLYVEVLRNVEPSGAVTEKVDVVSLIEHSHPAGLINMKVLLLSVF